MFGFGKRPVPGGKRKYSQNQPFEGNPLTSDRERYMRNVSVLKAAPELAIGTPTIGWLKAALNAIERVGGEKFAPRVRVPVLMLAASDDHMVQSKAIEELAIRLRAGSQIVLRGSRHEILQERDTDPRAVLGGVRRLHSRRRAQQGQLAGEQNSPRAGCTSLRSPAATMRPPLARVAALPGGDDAAGPLDDRNQRQDVERLQPGLDHEIDMADRQQAIIVAVAAEAPQPHGAA